MIIAGYKTKIVKVNDYFESGGIEYASIEALQGEPFVGGNRWPVHTRFTIAEVAQLAGIHEEPEPIKTQPNLLALALAQEKPQWYSGEAVWIWKNGKQGAFLKNHDGFVYLCLTGRDPGCVIFYLDRNGWERNHRLNESYTKWVEKVGTAK